MASWSVSPANITFNEMEFAFPSNAKLHSINESHTIFAYLIEEDELIISKSYQIHVIRLKDIHKKHKISDKLPSKPNDMKFITIHNSSKSMKKENKTQYSLVIGYENGSVNVMDIDCNIIFTQHISNTYIQSISLHFDNCFYSYCPSLILNCQSDLLFITADEIYRTLSLSLRDTLHWNESNDMDSIIATLWSPKKIILTQTPSQIVDIISIPPIDLMKHGIKLSLLDPEPPLNLYTSNQLFLIIIGHQPCITYVQIEKSSKGFGVREIKQGANKLVKSAFNLVTKSMSFGGVFSSFWGASSQPMVDSSDEDEQPNINARAAAQESIRNLQGTRYKIQCVFNDPNRKIEEVVLSPLRRYAALIDSYGRISVLDCKTCCIVRMFKGCRGAQCGWLQLDGSSVPTPSDPNTDIYMTLDATPTTRNKPSKATSFSLPWTLNKTLLLVIYIAPRGILEIYDLSIKHRLGALLFNLNGLLLYHLSLFEQSKYHDGDPSHIFLCDHSGKQSTMASTFSLQRFAVPKPEDIVLDDLNEEDLRFGGVMYKLQININHDSLKSNALVTPPSSACRSSPITFIHPTNALKVSTQNEPKEEDSTTDSSDLFDTDDDDDDDTEIPSANMLDATNFEETFSKYLSEWKLFMADIPTALIQVSKIASESDLINHWEILTAVPLKDTEIPTFCEFLLHVIHQIITHLTHEDAQFEDPQIRLWIFRKGCITAYRLLCVAYIRNDAKEKINLTLAEWSAFWIAHYMKPMSEAALMDRHLSSDTHDEEDTDHIERFSQFLFGVIALESEHIIVGDDDEEVELYRTPYKIPPLAMESMELPSAVLALYLELFLFWFVTEKSHKWLWHGGDMTEEEVKDEEDDEGTRWQRMSKAMKAKLHRLYEEKDASTYPGYHWTYLLDYDSLNLWLNSNRVSGFGDIEVDWTHKRYDEFLSNPLNLTEQRYLPTVQYYVNTGGQLLGLLRDYVQNTTQLTHAFLMCRVSDYIYNERSNGVTVEEDSDTESTTDPVNNEWIIRSSRILKAKIFCYLLDYNHHSENYIASLNTTQDYYMISLKRILQHYYRSGYSLNDIEEDLPISRLLAKYILSQMPTTQKHKLQQIYAEHEAFIATLLFMFDVMDYTMRVKSYNYDGIARYVALKQNELQMDYLDSELMERVLINVYYVLRIVPDHMKLEWLILYCLFDIYEEIVSQESIPQQLILLHKFGSCCGKILRVYGASNVNIQLQIIILNGQLWYYVLSSLLNRHVLRSGDDDIELEKDMITTAVEWIKFVSNIIDSLIVLQSQNKDENTIVNSSGQGYQREKAYLYEDKSELASWPPKSTAMSFICNQYLQPGTLLFFTSRAVIYTAHLKSMLNLYLQILRLYFVSMRAKIGVVAAHSSADDETKHSTIYLYDIFPDFSEFDSILFTFEWFQSSTSRAEDDNNNKLIKYDGVKSIKFESVMMIAKKWIAGALDLASSWHLDVNKVKRYIITELCNNYKDEIAIQLMQSSSHNHSLALSLLHVVKKRLCFHINQLLHSPQHQHLLAGIPADWFQDLLHYNNNNEANHTINQMNKIIKMSISKKDKKQIKHKPNKVLEMNLKLTLAINSLLQHDDFYDKKFREQINMLVQIINLLMHTK
eukprot:218802_1